MYWKFHIFVFFLINQECLGNSIKISKDVISFLPSDAKVPNFQVEISHEKSNINSARNKIFHRQKRIFNQSGQSIDILDAVPESSSNAIYILLPKKTVTRNNVPLLLNQGIKNPFKRNSNLNDIISDQQFSNGDVGTTDLDINENDNIFGNNFVSQNTPEISDLGAAIVSGNINFENGNNQGIFDLNVQPGNIHFENTANNDLANVNNQGISELNPQLSLNNFQRTGDNNLENISNPGLNILNSQSSTNKFESIRDNTLLNVENPEINDLNVQLAMNNFESTRIPNQNNVNIDNNSIIKELNEVNEEIAILLNSNIEDNLKNEMINRLINSQNQNNMQNINFNSVEVDAVKNKLDNNALGGQNGVQNQNRIQNINFNSVEDEFFENNLRNNIINQATVGDQIIPISNGFRSTQINPENNIFNEATDENPNLSTRNGFMNTPTNPENNIGTTNFRVIGLKSGNTGIPLQINQNNNILSSDISNNQNSHVLNIINTSNKPSRIPSFVNTNQDSDLVEQLSTSTTTDTAQDIHNQIQVQSNANLQSTLTQTDTSQNIPNPIQVRSKANTRSNQPIMFDINEPVAITRDDASELKFSKFLEAPSSLEDPDLEHNAFISSGAPDNQLYSENDQEIIVTGSDHFSNNVNRLNSTPVVENQNTPFSTQIVDQRDLGYEIFPSEPSYENSQQDIVQPTCAYLTTTSLVYEDLYNTVTSYTEVDNPVTFTSTLVVSNIIPDITIEMQTNTVTAEPLLSTILNLQTTTLSSEISTKTETTKLVTLTHTQILTMVQKEIMLTTSTLTSTLTSDVVITSHINVVEPTFLTSFITNTVIQTETKYIESEPYGIPLPLLDGSSQTEINQVDNNQFEEVVETVEITSTVYVTPTAEVLETTTTTVARDAITTTEVVMATADCTGTITILDTSDQNNYQFNSNNNVYNLYYHYKNSDYSTWIDSFITPEFNVKDFSRNLEGAPKNFEKAQKSMDKVI